MKNRMFLSFLAGAVLPLVLAMAFQRVPRVVDIESDTISPAETVGTVDADTVLAVRNRAGNVQQMTLREYLVGVVLAEMPADFKEEALKAQAVVARTYTRKRMEGSKHASASVCMDPGCCQGYRAIEEYLEQGGRQASVDKVRRAVEETDGLVLCYEGTLIDATYFSCSGGSTEDAVAVWGRDVPYLQAVQSPGEEDAPRFSDSVTFSSLEFAEKLGLTDNGKPEGWFGAVTYTDGGGVQTMVIRGREFTGTQLRAKLGLRSTAIEVSVSGKKITVITRGFGHRVGMSQYGAQAMAEAGSDFTEILAHYYTGAELVTGVT